MASDERSEDADHPADKLDSQLFVEAVSGAHDAIIITDAALDAPGPHILYVNKAFERLSG